VDLDELIMEIPTLESDHLILREYSPDDLESFERILRNRNVIKYLPRTDPWSSDVIEKWLLSAKDHWLEEGFGWWILEDKSDQNTIGWCGLRKLKDTGEVEVLYLLSEEYWGRGLATEAAMMSIQFGFQEAGLSEIIGLVIEENIGSKRVLEKSGFVFQDETRYFDIDCLRYKIMKLDHDDMK
jgi:ribosomal-protein-alanine N-acetyltransferase